MVTRQHGQTVALIGGAGTGKTTKLVSMVLSAYADEASPILALTFMQGARARLKSRLTESSSSRGSSVVCQTLDSFCLMLVRRFRSVLGLGNRVVYPICNETECQANSLIGCYLTFSELRSMAAELLQKDHVSEWLACSYACLAVDEFQDCNEELLSVVEGIAASIPTYVAADEFQVLNESGECPSIAWIEDRCQIKVLSEVHRTDDSRLLAAAAALRNGEAGQTGVAVMGVKAPGLAAWEVARRIGWEGWGRAGSSIAMLCPCQPSTSGFFDQALVSIGKRLGKTQKIGPYPFRYEVSRDPEEDRTVQLVEKRIAEAGQRVPIEVVHKLSDEIPSLRKTVLLARSEGVDLIEKTEVLECARRSTVWPRRGLRQNEQGRIATTIHGAKNREFDYVAVLWPYETPSNGEYQRRLLYNALTRARKDAVILVQGGQHAVYDSCTMGLLVGDAASRRP